MTAFGALAGGVAGVGILLMAVGIAARRPVSIADRIAPYLTGPSSARQRRDDLGVRTDASTFERLVGPMLRSLATRVGSLLGGGDEVQRRLVAAGRPSMTPDAFRLEQITWAALGLAGYVQVSRIGRHGVPILPHLQRTRRSDRRHRRR